MNIEFLLDPTFCMRMCLTLLHSLWQMTLLAVLAGLTSRLWTRRSVERTYSLHAAALIAGLAALPVTFAVVDVSSPEAAVSSENAPVAEPATLQETVPIATVPRRADNPNAGFDSPPPVPSSMAPPVSPPAAAPEVVATSRWQTAVSWIVALYALGVLIMLARLLIGLWSAHRLAKRAQPLDDNSITDLLHSLARQWSMRMTPALAVAEHVIVPKVVGLLRPTILLPASAVTGLSTDELQMILAHELSHIRRHDLWVNLLQRVAETVLFFNPALWYLSRRVSTLREFCCDELTCRAMDAEVAGESAALSGSVGSGGLRPPLAVESVGDPRTRYAAALVRVAELSRPTSAPHASQTSAPSDLAALAATNRRPSDLRRRIAHLFGEPIREPLRLSRGGLWGIVTIASLITFGLPLIPTGAQTTDSETKTNGDESPTDAPNTFSFGGKVEVVVIGTHGEEPQRWWDAEGEPIESVPSTSFQDGRVGAEGVPRRIVLRLDGLPEDAEVKWDIMGSTAWTGGDVKFAGEQPSGRYFTRFFITSEDRKSIDLRVGVATGAWKTVAEMRTNAPMARGFADTKSLVYSGAFDTPRGATAIISHNYFDHNFRVVAVDKHGANFDSTSRGGYSAGNIYQTRATFPNLMANEIDHFEFQTREYEWVEINDLPLNPRDDVAEASVEQEAPQSQFELSVVEAAGKPVPRALVEVRTEPKPGAEDVVVGEFVRTANYGPFVRTDENGRLVLRMPEEQPERFNLSIKTPGYGPYWAGWSTVEHPQMIPARFTAELEEAWSVGGIVVDEQGVPVEGVQVRPSVQYKKRPGDTDQLGVGTRIRTDAEGRWRFDSVPVSKSDVHVEITHPDFKPLRRKLPRDGFGLALEEQPTAKIALEKGLTVTGRVTDENGDPIAGALVRTKFLNDIREARTDEGGGYTLVGCEPRMARIVVSAAGRATDVQEVRVDPDMPPVNFSMQPGGKVRIRVVDEDGKGIPRARIFFQEWRGQFDYFEFDHVSQYADENGVWEWNEAPLDEFRADICRPDGMQLNKQSLMARDREYVFTPPRALIVSGEVLDARTKEPVEKFRVTPGLRNPDPEIRMNWIPGDSYDASGGKYRIRFTHSYPAHLVRIEADGYQVAISRDIKSNEGEVRVDFELQPAPDVAATIIAVDGEPAAGAKIALGVAGSQISMKNGEIDDGSTYASRLDADANGKFSFPARTEPFQLVITHPSGYAHIKSSDGRIPSRIVLTPWARVEGALRVGAEPAPNVRLTLDTNTLHSYGKEVPNIFTHHDITTGTNGRYVFERVVPGTGWVGRHILLMVDEGAMEVTSSKRVKAVFPAGETTRLDLGGDGRAVVGKLIPPDRTEIPVLWSFAMVNAQLHVADPPRPTPPDDVQRDAARLKAWWEQWAASPSGKVWQIRSEAARELREANPYYTATVDRDGTFRIDDVEPGRYMLMVHFSEHAAGSLNGYEFTVPPIDGDEREPIDLGELQLQ